MDLRLIGQKDIPSGILFDLTDSTVVLSPRKGLKQAINTLIRQHNGTLPPTTSLQTVLHLQTYRYDKIRQLKLHRAGNVLKGFLLGAAVGVIVGSVMAAAIPGTNKPGFTFTLPASYYIVGSGLGLSVLGALSGILLIESVNDRTQSVGTEMTTRFRKFAIVEQVNKANR